MARPESWETVARALGERMAHHAHCADHPTMAQADPDGCPFCHDRAVYLRFVAKAGKPADPLEAFEAVNLWDIPYSD